jgi:hypothetical protein
VLLRTDNLKARFIEPAIEEIKAARSLMELRPVYNRKPNTVTLPPAFGWRVTSICAYQGRQHEVNSAPDSSGIFPRSRPRSAARPTMSGASTGPKLWKLKSAGSAPLKLRGRRDPASAGHWIRRSDLRMKPKPPMPEGCVVAHIRNEAYDDLGSGIRAAKIENDDRKYFVKG